MIETLSHEVMVESKSDLRSSTLSQYGALKIGDAAAVDAYARLLAPRAGSRLHQLAAATDWLLASTPMHVLPAASNLLASRVQELMRECSPRLRVESLGMTRAPIGDRFLEDHYSCLNRAQRETHVDRTFESVVLDRPLLNAHVLVINDVRVTGAQERRLAALLKSKGVRRVHWQYLCCFAEQVAPDTEDGLNSVGVASDEAFVRHLSKPDHTLTTKCVWRLLRSSSETFAAVMSGWSAQQRELFIAVMESEQIPSSDRSWRDAAPAQPR